jgi:hypothetical protein
MAFAQRGSVRTEDERMMSKNRRLPSQSTIDQDLPGSVGEVVISPYDMGDMHRMVVNDTGKIVSRHPIGTNDDEITDPVRIETHPSVDEIFEDNHSLIHPKPENGPETSCLHFRDIPFGEGTASSIIFGHHAPGELLLAKGFEPFRRAETFIDFSFTEQFFRIVTIEREALGLTIGTVLPFSIRPFLPEDPQPSEVLEDRLDGSIGRSLRIGIFDPQNECTSLLSGKEIVEEGGASISDMEKPGGGRGETNTNISTHISP